VATDLKPESTRINDGRYAGVRNIRKTVIRSKPNLILPSSAITDSDRLPFMDDDARFLLPPRKAKRAGTYVMNLIRLGTSYYN
jgi:hypothetical protein